MAVPYDLTSFSAGEISPSLFGRVDLAKFNVGAATLRNMYVGYRGGAYSRPGTLFCAQSRQSVSGYPPRMIRFQFSVTQGYALEFGEHYMRVFVNGAPVVEAGFVIASIVATNPIGMTITGAGYAVDDWITIQGCVGASALNGNTYIVQAGAGGTYTLLDLDRNPIDGSAFGSYVNGSGNAARTFTLATPYPAADLPMLKFTQSADEMSFTHPNHPPYDLTRINSTNWVFAETRFTSATPAPTSCQVVSTTKPSSTTSPPTLPAGYAYVATAVNAITKEESIASPIGTCVDGVDIAQTAGSNVVTIGAVAEAGSYNIYKAPTSYNTVPGSHTAALAPPAGSSFGYVGTIFGTQFVDSNVTADLVQVPPKHGNPFAQGAVISLMIGTAGSGYTAANVAVTSTAGFGFVGEVVIVNGGCVAVIVQNGGEGYAAGDTALFTGDGAGAGAAVQVGPTFGTYPGCVAYYQQRRVYASSLNNPDTYWMSQPGLFQNFDSSIPVTDADAITGSPWSQQVNGIQAMVPMPGGLVVLTGNGAWQVSGSGGSALNPQALTPSNQQAQPQAFNGCNQIVPPIPVGNDILYVQSKGSKVRDLNYNFYLNIYTGVDLTQISGHLFDGFTIREMCWCEEPFKMLWAVRSDTTLLSLTYLKEQEVYGWARHDTAGNFFSVCSVVENEVDALYLVVKRQRGAGELQQEYFIERMDNGVWKDVEDCWCVDSGLRLPQPRPQAALVSYNTPDSGAATFLSSSNVFSTANLGSVIRAGGGIAVVTQIVNASQIIANMIRPITQFLDAPQSGSVLVAPTGSWSMTVPVQKISGLDHLVGVSVTGLADGMIIPYTVVAADGTIALPFPASSVTVGIGFQAQFQSVYANVQTQPTEQGRRKDIEAATVRIEASAGIKAGTNQIDGSTLFPPGNVVVWPRMVAVKDQGMSYQAPGGEMVRQLFTGDQRVNLFAAWRKAGQVALQQDNPLPMNILDVEPEALEGDTPEQSYAPQQQRDPRQVPRGPGAWMFS